MPPAIEVAAVAGRRIDAPNAEVERFPPSAEAAVKHAVTRFLKAYGVGTVVVSAACGADILALEAAQELALRSRIVLPFDQVRFRETSVVDRDQSWGPRYDAVLAAAAPRGDVIVLEPGEGDDNAAYDRATRRIIDEALTLARAQRATPIAFAIWDQQPRGPGDATQDFVERWRAAGVEVVTVDTREGRQ